MPAESHDIAGTFFCHSSSIQEQLCQIATRVRTLRQRGALSPEVLYRLRKYFKIKNIYHSNAIEGNILNVGETEQVVEMGLTLTGKPLKDQAEAKNLAQAVDFLEELAKDNTRPITEADIRQLHLLVLKGIDDENAGSYRKLRVVIAGSKYKPKGPEAVPVEMRELGDWLSRTSCPGENFASETGIIVAAAAHAWLVYIHPFVDGNGRVARLIMNLILMRYGFPIAIITRDDRLRYYDTLEYSQSSDLTPFIGLVSECITESLDEYEGAAKEQKDKEEWARSLASRYSAKDMAAIQNQYEIWKNAMELLKSYMQSTADLLNEQSISARVFFKDFGNLEFEKYLSLRIERSAKRTWFFRVDFKRSDKSARYLFFFGFRSNYLKDCCFVTLQIAREEPPGSWHYELLSNITAPNVPQMREIGYDIKGEHFVVRGAEGDRRVGKIEELGRSFFNEIIEKHFKN